MKRFMRDRLARRATAGAALALALVCAPCLLRAEDLESRPRQISALALLGGMQSPESDETPSGSTGVQPDPIAAPVVPQPRVLPPEDDGLDRIRYAHRSTTAAVLMSVPFPGWGQFYGESPFWGAVAFGAQMWFYGNMLLEMRRGERQRVARDAAEPGSAEREYRDSLALEHTERARDFVWWAAGSVLLVSLDSYVSVQLVDFDAPDPPTPDLDRSPELEGGNGGALALTLQLPF